MMIKTIRDAYKEGKLTEKENPSLCKQNPETDSKIKLIMSI